MAVTVALAMLVVPTDPAEARVTDGFDPGFIISDQLFYNGNEMTVAQVQAFLNQRIPRCTIGDSGRKPGDPAWWGGATTVASNCLNSFRLTTQNKVADAYCKSYQGRANESAAEILVRVGQACGISPKVLMVMLEKEQSLITDTWPTVKQYNIAMGYACPDTGPGGSANCDSNYYGFFNQVYWGARQLQVYRANPHLFRYKPGTNTIQWHPNAGCGTSQVRVENWATASLYIYTPYRPNQAALNAGWGTGDSCSSYGNRNFYNFYKTWFGQPNLKYSVHSAIMPYWSQNQDWLSNPTANAQRPTGGVMQTFYGGVVYVRSGGSAVGMTYTSPVFKAYANAGGPSGSWGWPVSPYTGISGYGSGYGTLMFQHGLAVERAGSRVGYIPSSLIDEWQASGATEGSWGWPISIGRCDESKSTCHVDFTRGVAVWSNLRGVQFTPFSDLPPDPGSQGSRDLVGGAT